MVNFHLKRQFVAFEKTLFCRKEFFHIKCVTNFKMNSLGNAQQPKGHATTVLGLDMECFAELLWNLDYIALRPIFAFL